MKFEKKAFEVSALIESYQSGSISRNEEYQRGAAWSTQQQQALVDSVFREYPLPSLFFEVKSKRGLEGEQTKKYEIIDGQQRILALVEYYKGTFSLLSSTDPKLRLPMSLRATKSPWGGKKFAELSEELQDVFKTKTVDGYLVQDVANPDEIRDLFIRLQSGTALTRQQIRDAWPGAIGPKIESWAGKLRKHPKYRFFDAVDGRGTRDEEDDSNDTYVKHRTTCAQLVAILLERAGNPFGAPSIKSADLDALYHKYTQASQESNPFTEIEKLFNYIDDVVSRINVQARGKKKTSKITLFALAIYLQDVHRNPNYKLTTETKNKLAEETRNPKVTQNSRASSGGVIRDYYERWRSSLPENLSLPLDSQRLFSDVQKQEIRQSYAGRCGICQEPVLGEDEEFDHYPTPHRDGGRTEVTNGRLVHTSCHPRGRPTL